jgi:hypothetical protein
MFIRWKKGFKMKMKRIIVCSLVLIITTLMVGCSGEAVANVSTSNGLSKATKLTLGTLKLEGSANAVSIPQATELLTLWEAYQSLSNSDTTSQVELDALVEQIHAVMTAEQIKAIEAMALTDQSVSEVMQSMGDSTSVNAPVRTPNTSELSQGAPMGGPPGMPGGGGDSVMSEINSGMVTQSTPAASQPTLSTQTNQVDGMLLNVLIRLLETRSQEAG